MSTHGGRDEEFMRRAIALAQRQPALPFGAVLVKEATGEIVGEGWNRTGDNPLLHGEIDAIQRCAQERPAVNWRELTLYTTAEPCPMCQAAVMWAGIRRVVYGTSIPTLQRLGWWQIDLRAEALVALASGRPCVIDGRVLEAECDALFVAAGKLQSER